MKKQKTATAKAGFFALWCLCQQADSEVVYHALNAARDEAMRRSNFEVAAALRDLRDILTNHYEPVPLTADELRAAASV